MEDLPSYIKTSSRRNKDMILVDNIYLFNLHHTNKDKSKVYKCVEYKTKKKCTAFIKLNKKEEIMEFSKIHNHKAEVLKTTKEETWKTLKSEIKKAIDPFSIKIPKLYKSFSADKGIKAPL